MHSVFCAEDEEGRRGLEIVCTLAQLPPAETREGSLFHAMVLHSMENSG